MPTFDSVSEVWIEPLSVILNCMFPIEYIYGEWYCVLAKHEALHPSSDPENFFFQSEANIKTGSRAEGFLIPDMYVPKNTADQDYSLLVAPCEAAEHWNSDEDDMTVEDNFDINKQNQPVPIFDVVFHANDDPRYVKLRLTEQWKDFRPKFKDFEFLRHSFLFYSSRFLYEDVLDFMNSNAKEGAKWTHDVHGPVRKLESVGETFKTEADQSYVFKFPQAWPEPAMEWLVRPRSGPWPSPSLIQDVFESGCHIAPVGRGKRIQEPLDKFQYLRDPSQSTSQEEDSAMDETEWRLSFSVAENKLGQSVTPVQRHVMLLLKMMKKFYFPDVGISTYILKNLLFWEIEKQNESFWKEDNSAKCLLHMLNRLQECVEEGCLPQYIVPESNLLAYEDPSDLAEAASLIFTVRLSILSKSIRMLRRSLTMTSQSATFQTGLQPYLEPLLGKLQDETLPDREIRELVCSLWLVFARRADGCISGMLTLSQRSDLTDYQRIQFQIMLKKYESLLARCLSKAWLARDSVTSDNEIENFIEYVKNTCERFSPSDEFLQLALDYQHHGLQGKDLGNLVPNTSAMQATREMYIKNETRMQERIASKFYPWVSQIKRSDFVKTAQEIIKAKKINPEEPFSMKDCDALLNEILSGIEENNSADSVPDQSESGSSTSE